MQIMLRNQRSPPRPVDCRAIECYRFTPYSCSMESW
uniref:Uncharacterized protein n=1 Tax=Anguilla anguilla TaxID=7936 RepID=A0A0E9PFB5_ANGAN